MGGLSHFCPNFGKKNQLILAQKQHPGPFLETREQELSFGTKINGIFCFNVGDISFLSLDQSSKFCMQAYVTACKLMDLHASWGNLEFHFGNRTHRH